MTDGPLHLGTGPTGSVNALAASSPSLETVSRAGADADSGAPLSIIELQRLSAAILANVGSVISGKSPGIRIALTVLLAEGHLLLEDVPGVGKTMLAKALAQSVDCTVSRIQFTPDLMPSEVTGISVYSQATQLFEFKPGPVFANIVIGDEINRASPKTQSALLECMAERQVTADGSTYRLASPFTVIATQNPVDMDGTFALPEAQRDRFMARMSLGYPGHDAELAMLDSRDTVNPLSSLRPVVSGDQLQAMIHRARAVFVSAAVKEYAVALVRATREHRDLRLGASPRATLHLVRAAKAAAALEGRDYVLPDDIDSLAVTVLAHRLIFGGRAQSSHQDSVAAIEEIVRKIVTDALVPLGLSDRD